MTKSSGGRHRARHRAPSSAPRNGAAALMIGGLVSGTVATAGATTLSNNPLDGARALGLGGGGLDASLADAVRDGQAPASQAATPGQDSAGAAESATLGSASIAELSSPSAAQMPLEDLRSQDAADRSEARSAPADAAAVTTVLAASGFTGTTLEVEEPEPAPAEEAPAEAAAATPAPQPEPAPPATPAPVGGSVLNIAAAYVGYPYVLYGTPPYSFDCSSYTWWVFQQAGISIPRTVAGQRGAVTPVSDPQPGDLVFYNDWYHVGIYAGNGMTYEALNPNTDVRYGPILSTNIWYGRING